MTFHHSPFNNGITQPRIIFLTLKIFSATGGIEKVCRIMGKALYEYGLQNGLGIEIMSMHDEQQQASNNSYFPAEIFSGFAGNKLSFVLNSINNGREADIIIISHINLLVVGWLIKKANPSAKIILIAHGIEIWGKLNISKKNMLPVCDQIICVSRFTADKIISFHKIANRKISIINNCIDPFLPLYVQHFYKESLRKKYNIAEDDTVLMTLTRLSVRDRYKGYDRVLEALVILKKNNRKIKYLLAGGYSNSEKIFIDGLIKKHGLADNVILTGYIPENDLTPHFLMADIYVMPSTKEGFGIVFIEAMYYGLPVIAGNQDGSTDALLDGKLGLLIEPNNAEAIATAVEKMQLNKDLYKPDHALLMNHFGFDEYKRKLESVLDNCCLN